MNNDLHTDIINETEAGAYTPKLSPKLSMDYVLSRIDKIINDAKYIDEALDTILEIPTVENSDGLNYQGDYAGQAKAEAVSAVVRSREETNQKLIQLLEKIYDDLKPKQPPEPTEEILKLQQLTEMLKNFPPEISADIIKKSAQQMFVKPATAVVM